MGEEHKETLEAIIAPSFLRGDVCLAIQCSQMPMLSSAERAACMRNVSKVVDCVSNVWTQYDEMSDPSLGAVVVVLEGCEEQTVAAAWSGSADDAMAYPVTPLDEELSAFFK